MKYKKQALEVALVCVEREKVFEEDGMAENWITDPIVNFVLLLFLTLSSFCASEFARAKEHQDRMIKRELQVRNEDEIKFSFQSLASVKWSRLVQLLVQSVGLTWS